MHVSRCVLPRAGRFPRHGRAKLIALPVVGLALSALYIIDDPPRDTDDVLFRAALVVLWTVLLARSLSAGIFVDKETCRIVYRGLLRVRKYHADDIAEFGMLDTRWLRGEGAFIMVRPWGKRVHVWWCLGDADEDENSRFLAALESELAGCLCGYGWEVYQDKI